MFGNYLNKDKLKHSTLTAETGRKRPTFRVRKDQYLNKPTLLFNSYQMGDHGGENEECVDLSEL